MIKFHLPLPPSLNNCYRNVKINLRIMTKEARMWKIAAQALATTAKIKQGWELSSKEKLVMELRIFWPDARRRDPDNILKILQDSLNTVLYADDCYVMPRVMDFSVDRDNPRLELIIYRFDQPSGICSESARMAFKQIQTGQPMMRLGFL